MKQDLAKNGAGTFLITFEAANVDAANSPDQMFSHAKLKKLAGSINSSSVDDFVESGEYHKARGEYVFQQVREHHEACKVILFQMI